MRDISLRLCLTALLGLWFLCRGFAVAGPVERQVLQEQGGWRAHIEIDCFLAGQTCGRFDYASLACQGELEFVGAHDNEYEFREHLKAGNCAPGCSLMLDSGFTHYRELCFGKTSGEGPLNRPVAQPPATAEPARQEPAPVPVNEQAPVAVPPPPPATPSTKPPPIEQQVEAPITAPAVRDCKKLANEPVEPTANKIQASTTTYIGDFHPDPKTGVVSGSGRILWSNGDAFIGSLVAGKKQGKGCLVWSNGQQYDGDWVEDRQTGQAVILFSNGNRYVGSVLDSVPEGTGSFFGANGERYSGEWKAGQKQGKGQFVWVNNQSYNGDWLADQASGSGAIVYSNGDRYTGEVVAGAPQGKGSKYFASTGDRYEGLFQQGEPSGEGSYLWKTGDKYTGSWREGKKNGQGRYTWANGDSWEGIFEDDKQGEGTLHLASMAAPSQEGVALMQQTRSASEAAGGNTPSTAKALDRTRMKAIPMVAALLQKCAKSGNAANCQQDLMTEIERGSYFKHDWQTMFSEKTPAGGVVSYEVDRGSTSVRSIVFSWFRFLDSVSGNSRETGVKYDCRSRALEIQLLFNCEGGAQPSACVLDLNFDKYVGKAIPAATIKGWFKNACERSSD